MERFKSVLARLTVAAISMIMLVSMTAGTAYAATATNTTKGQGPGDGSPDATPTYTWTGTPFTIALTIDRGSDTNPGSNAQQFELQFNGNPDVCSLADATVTVTGAGQCVVLGRVFAGGDYDTGRTDEMEIIINKGTQETLTALATPSSQVYGQTVTVTATGGTTGGTITFAKEGAGDCTVTSEGVATIGNPNLTSPTAVNCTVRATKAGNDNYNSVFDDVTITVSKANQDPFTATADDLTGFFGQTGILLTASGGSTGLDISYTKVSGDCDLVDGGGASNTATVEITALSTPAENCVFNATRLGSANYNSVTSENVTITVSKVTQAALTASAADTSGVYGQTGILLTASGGSGGGDISYTKVSGDCDLVDGGGASNTATVEITALSTPAEDCVFYATRDGGGSYEDEDSSNVTISVDKANQLTLTASASDTTGVYGQTINLTASGGSGTGDISYTKVAGGDCTLTDGGGASNTATVVIDSLAVSEDDCVFYATRDGGGSYEDVDSSNVTITVDRAAQTVLVVGTVGGDYIATTGESLTLTTSGGSSTGADTFAWVSGDCEVSANIVTVDGSAEDCVVEATSPGDANYLPTTARVTISVNKANQSALTAVATPTSAVVGQTVSLTASGGTTGLDISYTKVSGDCTLTDDGGALNTASVTIIAPGSAACVFNARRAGNADYNPVTSANVSITVGPSVTLPTTSSSPTISRSRKVMTVTSAGTWNANGGTLSVATYQWYQCSGTHAAAAASGSLVFPGNCVSIGGATTSPWTIRGVNRKHLRVLVTRSNEAGAAYAWSATIRR